MGSQLTTMQRIAILILFTFLRFHSDLLAQAPSFQWAKSFGGAQSEYANDIKIDLSGNIFVTGYFEGTIDFDPDTGVFNQTSNGISDVFILKLDASGNLMWVKCFGGTENDLGFALSLDSIGNCYVTGSFKSIVDFDPGNGVNNITSVGGDDAFVIKLDDTGNFIWVQTFAGSGNATGKDIFQSQGNIYITGLFTHTNDFDPGNGTSILTSNGSSDGFVCKLDLSGNLQWVGAFGGVNSDAVFAGAIDKFGNVYSTGTFSDVADFDPGTGITTIGAAGSNDIFISKWNSSGIFLWAKNIGGPGSDMGRGIAVDTSCSVYTTGYFMITADFDPGFSTYSLSSQAGWDMFVSKLDSAGNFLMAGSVGGTADDMGNSIEVDPDNNIYIAGGFNNNIDFDPGTGSYPMSSYGLRDIFILKLNSTGNFVWAKKMGGIEFDEGTVITTDGAGIIYTAGTFSGTADFNPPYANNLFTNGNEDFFIAKYDQSLLSVNEDIQKVKFEIFPNPVNQRFIISISNGLPSTTLTPIKFSLSDINGKIIRSETIHDTNEFTVNAHDLTQGVYYVRLEGNGIYQVKKVVILR